MDTVYHAAQQLPLFPSKVCTTCQIEKPLDEFYTRKDTKDGRTAQCKKCTLEIRHQDYIAKHGPSQRPIPLQGGKVCTKCHIEKPLEDFGKRVERKDGLQSRCKACMPRTYRATGSRVFVPPPVDGKLLCTKCQIEKPFSEFSRETRRKTGYSARCKECLYQEHREYYALLEDKEQILMKNRRWYEENRERHRELYNRWRQENPLRSAEMCRRHAARKRDTAIGEVRYEHILERDGYWCYICESDILPHHSIDFDHVIPLSREGVHTEENIKVTHAVCNRRKNDKLLSELAPYQRRGIEQ